MIRPESALRIILEHVQPLSRIRQPLERSLGHCLAEDIRADRDMPAADRSAMDGYAIRFRDLADGAAVLRVKAEVAAGSPARPRVTPGACVRIFTGGNLPPGADTVVIVEETSERENMVTIRTKARPGDNIRRHGEDAAKGRILLHKGTCLGPPQMAVCAAVGKAEVRVHKRPKVIVLCTGEELRQVADSVRAHEIRNSNGPALCAALAQWGFENVAHRTAPDDLARLVPRLRRAVARYDAILLTGGVSMGKYDLVPEAVERVGAKVHVHGVAMRPGKPLLYATLPKNRHIFGLPGNPISVMFTFNDFALPALRRMSGASADKCRLSLRLPFSGRVHVKPGRQKFLLGRIRWRRQGPCAVPVKFQGSADLVAAGGVDGLIAVPFGVTEIGNGTMVDFRPWRPLP